MIAFHVGPEGTGSVGVVALFRHLLSPEFREFTEASASSSSGGGRGLPSMVAASGLLQLLLVLKWWRVHHANYRPTWNAR